MNKYLKGFVLMLKPIWKAWSNFKIGLAVILLRKEVDCMAIAIVYATLIMNGRKEFSQVPARIKDNVKEVLIDLGLENLTQE